MGRTRDVSKILTSNTSILSLASASSIYQTKASAGLNLVNATSFTAQTTVSINNVFSATYDNYFVVCNWDHSAANGSLEIRMRNGGTNRTGAAYNFTTLEWATSATVARLASQTAYLVNAAFAAGVEHNLYAHFYNPFISTRASGITCEVNRNTDASSVASIVSGGYFTNDSNDGFAFLVGAGTITGTVSVYGYNK